LVELTKSSSTARCNQLLSGDPNALKKKIIARGVPPIIIIKELPSQPFAANMIPTINNETDV